MLNRTAVHEHRIHGYSVGTVASGRIGAGGSARFEWDGHMWQPSGRTDAASITGALTTNELHQRLQPDLATITAVGPGHWGTGSRFTEED